VETVQRATSVLRTIAGRTIAGAFAILLLGVIGCLPGQVSGEPFRIIAGSENQTLEPIVQELAKRERVPVEVTYRGSVDIMLELDQGAATRFDAVWPANSLWISLGDRDNLVKRSESIMRSPVVLGVKRPVAQQLGWVGRDVTVREILAATEAGKLRFMMTSASQSNSGAAAFLGYLHAFAGGPDVLTSQDLQKPEVRDQVRRILGTVNRSAGSSGWLKDLFLQRYDTFDAMVNYEALVIEANQELTKQGRQPLYAVYPVDGLTIADSPLGYINRGDPKKEAFFDKLQKYLLTDDAQQKILKSGRRVGPIGVNPANADPSVFRTEWGIDVGRVLAPIRFPSADVIREALTLYQTTLRKPSATVFCLDVSGSMQGRGLDDLKAAMHTLLDPQEASRHLLQTGPDDLTVVLLFNHGIAAEWTVEGNKPEQLGRLFADVNRTQAGGNTNIYLPVTRGLDLLKRRGYEGMLPSIILMTDGQSNQGSFADVRGALTRLQISDVPIHAILFGEASERQLKELTDATTGRIFDGRTDLIRAFREAKGYN
jgi:Ca-activated chloride channel family protein